MSFSKNNGTGPQDSYKKNFFTLATGRIIAQTIPILLTPFLTRLYLPQEFGIFAIFLAITAVFSLIANGRYNLAIMLPEKEKDVLNIFSLSVIMNFLFSFFLFLLILIFKDFFLKTLSFENYPLVLYLIPLGTFLQGFAEPLHYLSLRKKHFKIISLNMIFQFSTIAFLKIAFAFLSIGALGLIWGHILGYILGIFFLLFLLFKKNIFFDLKNTIKKTTMFELAKEYKKFPMYSLPADTLGSISNQMPNILLNNFFGSAIVGHFSLTQKVLATPINMISGAITDVFREKASDDYRKTNSCREIFKKTFSKLFLFSIVPFLFLFIFAPSIVPYIFGELWAPAGEYIRIMTLLFFLGFSIGPVSSVLYITQKQNYRLVWEIFSVMVIFLSFYLGFKYFNQYTAIALYTFSLSFMYIILLVMSYRFSEKSNEKT